MSTIEAIAHTAHAAGLDDQSFHNLLLLFRLQKLRVLDRVRQGNSSSFCLIACIDSSMCRMHGYQLLLILHTRVQC